MSTFKAKASNSMLVKFGDLQGRPCCTPRSSPALHLAGVHFALGFALGIVLVFCLLLVINLWNSLPDEIVTADSVNSFKNGIDFHLREYMFSTGFNLYY